MNADLWGAPRIYLASHFLDTTLAIACTAQFPHDSFWRVKQTKQTFHWDERKLLWLGEYPPGQSLKPFASAAGDAIFQVDHADNASSFEVFRRLDPTFFGKPPELFEIALCRKTGAGLAGLGRRAPNAEGGGGRAS
jgi:hypothetical protein